MKLEDLVNDINNLDEELIIFQRDELSINSEVALFDQEDEDIMRIKDGVEYVYFLEVSIAKEFINDWVKTLPKKPNSKEMALRLLQYAINDA